MALERSVFSALRDELLYGIPRVIELATVIGPAVARVARGQGIREVCDDLRRERPQYFEPRK